MGCKVLYMIFVGKKYLTPKKNEILLHRGIFRRQNKSTHNWIFMNSKIKHVIDKGFIFIEYFYIEEGNRH